jgi:hypothetical protein
MSGRRRTLLAFLLTLPALLPSEAMAANSLLLGVAEHSVAAAQHPTGSTTAFAYGVEGGMLTAGSGSVHAVTSTGVAITGELSTSRDGLGVAHVSALPLRALVATRATSISQRTPKYILGPPLGYEGGRIRAVRMPTVRVSGSQLLRVSGMLPAKFLGAPVVTTHGRLIGSVASVGARSWEFAPLGLIQELTAVHQGTSVPILPIVIGGLVVFLAGMAFGILRVKRRRDRELDLRLRQSRARGAAERRADGPLVRLRTPAEEGEPEQATEEDFDVIVKPRMEDS